MNDASPDPTVGRTRLALLLALGPFALGYFLSYLFRAVNAVVAPNLVAELGIDPAQLGLLTGAYLLTFAAFQLPLGVLLDRYGPRRVQAALFTCAALGALLFALGNSVWTLTFARALIGLGFAGGLMAGFKAVVIWVSEGRRALANACIMSFGALGVIVATLPTELAIQAIGWRGVFLALSAITLAVAALIALAVPERPGSAAAGTLGQQIAGLSRILASRAFWRLAPVLALTAGTHIAIQTLWAGPWFSDVAGLDRSGVATHLMIVAIAFLVGILLTGVAADWLSSRGVSRLTVMSGFVVAFIASQLLIIWGPDELMIASWVVFGMSGQASIIAYPWLSSYYGAAMAGRANTAMNLGVFACAFIGQSLMGEIIGRFAPDAAGAYPLAAYQAAFGVFVALQLAAYGWYLMGRELQLHPEKREAAGQGAS
ncbi:MAG TPA: MFS transporter [Afifellaceae bacterium]|nr:MFS transporter [Afifellaceae bacterium]